MNRKAALAALVSTDIALKFCAWLFLRARAPSLPAAGCLRLGYVQNGTGFGFDQARLLARYGLATDDAFVLCTLAVFLVFALVIYLWHRIKGRAWLKTVVAAVIYFAAATLALSLHDSLIVSLSPYLRGVLRSLGPLAVALVLFLCVVKPYYATAATLFLAGTVGNCGSLLLPPFAVIDYFGMYRTSIQGFVYGNAADAYLLAAAILIALIPFYLLLGRVAQARGARIVVP